MNDESEHINTPLFRWKSFNILIHLFIFNNRVYLNCKFIEAIPVIECNSLKCEMWNPFKFQKLRNFSNCKCSDYKMDILFIG